MASCARGTVPPERKTQGMGPGTQQNSSFASENPWPPFRVAGVSGSDSTPPGGATTRRRKQEVAEGGNRKWLLEALGTAARYATGLLRGL